MADLDALRETIRVRARAIATTAAAQLVADLEEAAPAALPSGAITSTVVEQPTIIGFGIRLDQEAEATTAWEWVVGDPASPFEPHQHLQGIEFTELDWREVLAKDPSDFPSGGTYYFPQDHKGCQCSAEIVLGDKLFDPAGLAAQPVTVSAFGQEFTVIPAAPGRDVGNVPAWWSQNVTQENWERLIGEAAAST